MSIENKTIIISGASRGLGRAATRLFAEKGANVVATARTAEDLQTLADEYPDRIAVVAGDVANEADMQRVVQTALDRFGGIDIVINNAGYGVFKMWMN